MATFNAQDMESPIQLTEEQKKQVFEEKSKKFIEGVKKLEDETGLMLVATLNYLPTGIQPRIQFIDKPHENKQDKTVPEERQEASE